MLLKIVETFSLITGISAITTYGTLNYATYRLLNEKKEGYNHMDVESVRFSPMFNYHKQLRKQMDEKKWSHLTYEGEIGIDGLSTSDIKISYDLRRSGAGSFTIKYKDYENRIAV